MRTSFVRSALLTCAILIVAAASSFAQTAPKMKADPNGPADIRSSAAYAEVLLKKIEVQSEVEALAVEYTDDFPKLAEARFALESIEKERLRLLAQKPGTSKLSLALGKLMVRKAEQEVELWTLRRSLQEAHPDVKRAKRKVDIFEAAIKEILG